MFWWLGRIDCNVFRHYLQRPAKKCANLAKHDPGRKVKQEQEEIYGNRVPPLLPISVHLFHLYHRSPSRPSACFYVEHVVNAVFGAVHLQVLSHMRKCGGLPKKVLGERVTEAESESGVSSRDNNAATLSTSLCLSRLNDTPLAWCAYVEDGRE